MQHTHVATYPETPENSPKTGVDEVINFLRKNPEFFQENKAILEDIIPNGAMEMSGNVVSMQGIQVRKLQEQITSYKRRNMMLIQTSMENQKSFEDIHTLILNLMRCTTVQCIERTVTAHISTMNVDSVRFLTVGEAENQISAAQISALQGDEYHSTIIRTLIDGGDTHLHGSKAEQMKSDALLILHALDETPLALIAMGSTDAERFHEGQGTELLTFLSQFIGYRLAEVMAG